MPLYKQANEYYCGPACGRMILRFVTGQFYSQAHLANYDNMRTDYHGQTIMYRLTHTLNSKIGSSVYQHVGTWNANFGNDLIFSIDRNSPMVPQVRGRNLPNYPNNHPGGGHYIVAIGYQYGFSGGSGFSNVTYHDPHINNNHFGTYTCSVSTMVLAINDHLGWYARATR